MSSYSLEQAAARGGQAGNVLATVVMLVIGLFLFAMCSQPKAEQSCAATLASLGSEAPTGREYRALQQICRSVR